MGCQKCGARKTRLVFSTPLAQVQYVSFCFPSPSILQASLVRESENMVRDTATRLEQAAGELGDLIVRATLSPPFLSYDPADADDIRHPLKEMRNWSRIRNYAMLRPSLWRSVVLDDGNPTCKSVTTRQLM